MTLAPLTAALTLSQVADGEYALTTVAPAAAAAVAASSAIERYMLVRVPTGPTMIATFPPAALAGAGAATLKAAASVMAATKAAPVRSRNKGLLENGIGRRAQVVPRAVDARSGRSARLWPHGPLGALTDGSGDRWQAGSGGRLGIVR